MISKVAISFDIIELKKISRKGLVDYMKKLMVDAIKQEIDKTKINLHIDINDHQLKAGYVTVYVAFELNLEVEKYENC